MNKYGMLILVFMGVLLHVFMNTGNSYSGFISEQVINTKLEAYICGLYEESELAGLLDYRVFRFAVIGYINMRNDGLLSDKKIIAVIDYTVSANKERFFVIDLDSKRVLYHTLVAHGKNTGNKFAKYFSNIPKTQKSSLGFYITAETYFGKHGYSLRLDGIDSSYNDNARGRQIIIHGAHYVSSAWAEKYGRIGRSWGCPALPEQDAKEIIDTIKNGCCLFVYYDDKEYLKSSEYLNVDNDIIEYFTGVGSDG
jgi:hypothetical protein